MRFRNQYHQLITNIYIHLEIDVDSADEFINNVKELSVGNVQIIVVG